MKHFQDYETSAQNAVSPNTADFVNYFKDVAGSFHEWRSTKMSSIETGRLEWNAAVASAVQRVAEQDGLIARVAGESWFRDAQRALCDLDVPLHSGVILSTDEPLLKNEHLEGRLRTFGNTTLSEDPEFMPNVSKEWPMFDYFNVEPGTSKSLSDAGLLLFANPPGTEQDEKDAVGSLISSDTYGRSPMVSIEIRAKPLQEHQQGAFLLNWSFKGRQGAKAKIFIDGLQDVESFGVASTDDDPTPNFWTVLPWKAGLSVVDLKHVGSGFLWFEHCDVHQIIW